MPPSQALTKILAARKAQVSTARTTELLGLRSGFDVDSDDDDDDGTAPPPTAGATQQSTHQLLGRGRLARVGSVGVGDAPPELLAYVMRAPKVVQCTRSMA